MDHEDEFLNTFFSHLSHLCFDKAKEHLEREKDACKSFPLTPWAMLLTHLPQILLAEKSYIELGCLTTKNKGFLRKENSLRAIYDGLRVEMKRLEDVAKLSQEIDENFNGDNQPIPYYVAEFLTARIDLIDLYEKLFQLGSCKNVKYTNVLQQIDLIQKKHEQGFTHIALTPIKAVVTLEIEILSHLLEALDSLQKLEFIPSVTQLYGAHTRILVWENSLQNRETWKLGFGTTFLKNNPQPLLFQWLVKLKCSTLSKFSLYFHNTLAQQTTTQEMRQLCSKQQVDYYSKLLSFHRRYDVTLICLLFDNRGYETDLVADQSNAFSVIVCYPTKNVMYLIDNFIKIITEKTPDLSNVDKYAFLYNPEDNHTYTVANIEQRIHILLIFDGKKTEKDIHISNFITEMSGQLRLVKNFTNLKISSK